MCVNMNKMYRNLLLFESSPDTTSLLQKNYIVPVFANEKKKGDFHFFKKDKKWEKHSVFVLQQALIDSMHSEQAPS